MASAADWTTMIANIDAAITTRISGGVVEEYLVRGRSVKYSTLKELRDLRDWAARKLAATKGAPFVLAVPGRAGG